MAERTSGSTAAPDTDNGSFVNAVVTVLIPLDGINVTDDKEAKLEAAVAAVEASPLGEMEEVTTVTFEDVGDDSDFGNDTAEERAAA